MNLNKVFIMGNLTRDPDFRQTTTGQSVCTMSLATNSFFTSRTGEKQKKAEFHTIVLWGRQAEIANQFLKKGASALVEGRLQTRSWTDKEGKPRKVTEIVGERLQLGPRPSGAGGGFSKDESSQDTYGDAFTPDDTGKEESFPEVSIDEEIKSEDIPF